MENLYNGFTHQQLEDAFQKVQSKTSWKDPIDSVVPEKERKVVGSAVEFYTATQAEFTDLRDGLLRVRAIGYRMGPAGP